jgi:hypothetical protein
MSKFCPVRGIRSSNDGLIRFNSTSVPFYSIRIDGTVLGQPMRAASVRTGSPMCDKCVEVEKKIEHYRRTLLSIGDQITFERLEALIADLREQKATLHPEQKQ